MMRAVLTACHRMLAPDGSLYLHIDYRMNPYLRLMLDEIFGQANFMNEIIWAYKSGGRSTRHFSRKHDTILFYRKSKAVYFNIHAVGVPRGPEKRNNMKRSIDELGRVYFSIRSGGKTYTYYEDTPIFPSDVWDDVEHLHQRDPERTGFGTQKPEALLRRILLASSRPGDLVCDLFSGSGTTAAVAAKLGRRFLVADASPVAMQLLRARQLVNQSEPTFFDGGHALRILYDTPPLGTFSPAIRIERTADAAKVYFDGCADAELAYLAARRTCAGRHLYGPCLRAHAHAGYSANLAECQTHLRAGLRSCGQNVVRFFTVNTAFIKMCGTVFCAQNIFVKTNFGG